MNHTISLTPLTAQDLKLVSIGHAQDPEAGTGVTVLYFPQGATVGCDISGGGPASRETPLADPLTADNPVNAIVLSGGSAYGLAAADGVMSCLEAHGIGFDTGAALVPLVLQSCIYDLGFGSAKIRPDAAMGAAATERALAGTDGATGNVGGGTGATVGKLCGMPQAEKSGLGFAAVQAGELIMAAVVIVNALGDIFDPRTGRKIAGLKNPQRSAYLDTNELLWQLAAPRSLFTGNTTIGAVITNGDFSKAEMTKIAAMTRNAYARCINPVGTLADGDTIYAAAVREVKADINMAGTLAAEVMTLAIQDAIQSARMDDAEYLRRCGA